MTHPQDRWTDWIGRNESRLDFAAAAPLEALAATLDRVAPESVAGVPPLWHWLYFWPTAQQQEIGTDGHPKRGGFLPPIPLPRRMWAGGRLRFHRPLEIGSPVSRQSVIDNLQSRHGRSGGLVFVTVKHEISDSSGLAITEEQDIVYRDAPQAGAAAPAARPARTDAEFSREIRPDPVLLFRYSALTFNSHRIHYDRPYALQEEGYPGLVVHGPLTATLLLDLLRHERPQTKIAGLEFRGVSPLFDTRPFTVNGRRDKDGSYALWAADADGLLAMEAIATVEEGNT